MSLHTLLLERSARGKPVKVGVIGAGKFASMFLSQARIAPGIQVVGIAELQPDKAADNCLKVGWPRGSTAFAEKADAINDVAAKGVTAITPDALELIRSDCEVILEITGNPEAGTLHSVEAIKAGKHLVMANVETDCLVGPLLAEMAGKEGVCFSMAYGDQPALIMELIDWARTVGFEVVCAGKGTRYQPHYHDSTPATVWTFYGLSEEMVATGGYNAQMFNSFLDGTKSAIEMCAVANAAGLQPMEGGLKFPPVGIHHLQDVLKPERDGGILPYAGTVECVASEDRFNAPVHDDLRWGVYVVLGAPTDYVKRCFAEYGMKTDKIGAYTALYRPYHFIGLELNVSIASVALRREPTGTSRYFMGDVAATAKKDLYPGEVLDGEGGFTVFGTLLPSAESLSRGVLPIGLSSRARIVRPVAKGEILSYSDAEADASTVAYRLRKEMEKRSGQGDFRPHKFKTET
ncbi:MAG: flagellar biosynthesis protein FlgA [Deltaproteobacteria bacterium]|nr:flagellar biosynthesis protein FlgA [Deltaproteobacteria bacterium]